MCGNQLLLFLGTMADENRNFAGYSRKDSNQLCHNITKDCRARTAKGQLISKCLFGAFKFFQNTNENKSTWGMYHRFVFVRLLEELRISKRPFEIN